MAGAAASGGRRSARGSPAFAAVVATGSLLVLTWPFVRVPRLDLVSAALHVFGAWIAVVVALWLVARGNARRPRDPGEGRRRG